MENRWLFCSEWFKAMKIMKANISKILGYLVFTFRSNTTLESRWQESLFQWTKLQVQSVPQYYHHHTPHCPETLKMKRTLRLSLTLCSNTLRSSTRFWWWWRKLMGGGGAVVISVRFCVYLFMIRHFLNGWKVQTTYKTQLSVNHFLNSGTTIVIWYALRKMFQSNKTELPLRARFRDKNSWSWVSTSCFTHFNLLIVLRVTALGRRRNLSFTILKQNERKGLQQFSSSHFATWKKYSDSRMWLLFHSRDVFGISSTAPQLMHLVKTGWRSIIIPDQISAAISPTCMKFSFSSSGAIVSLFKFRWDPNLSWGSTIPLNYWLNLTIQRSILLRELLPGLLVARENLSKSWVMK